MLKFEANSKGVHLNTLLTNFILSLVKLFLQNHLQKAAYQNTVYVYNPFYLINLM